MNVPPGWVVAVSPRGEVVLYVREAETVAVDPQRWLRRPAVVARGAAWALLADLRAEGPDFWIGPGGTHVAGWGLLVGVAHDGSLRALAREQLSCLRTWRWRDGPPLVEVTG